jgi:hypothetical protein
MVHKTQVPIIYARRLNRWLSGEPLGALDDLFAESARIERYVLGEPPRVYSGLEQIEESILRLPPIGGTFHITDVRVENNTVHARFHTRNFPYPMRGLYRFDLDPSGHIARLYISARYSPPPRN